MNHKTIVKHLENVTIPEIVYFFSGNYNLADFSPETVSNFDLIYKFSSSLSPAEELILHI